MANEENNTPQTPQQQTPAPAAKEGGDAPRERKEGGEQRRSSGNRSRSRSSGSRSRGGERSGGENKGGENRNPNRKEGEGNRSGGDRGKGRPSGGGSKGGSRGRSGGGMRGSKGGDNRTDGSGGKVRGKVPQTETGWFSNVKDAIAANKACHEERLTAGHRFGDTNFGVKIVPLGGLEQIGGNFMVMETENSAIVIDVGMSFPTDDMHGVDILVPDFTYLRQIKDKVAGVLITHAHEDHIGAVPYLFKELQFPLYGSPLPLAMIGEKFEEHQLSKYKNLFRYVEKRRQIKIGDFEVEWMHVTHSVIDASSLAITTEAGTIIHTGDFKIDHTPIDKFPTDYHRFAYYGDRGVLALLSDSTNSYNPGMTKSESVVGRTFDELFSKAKGRVIMSTFSSNIHRVFQAIEHGVKYSRKVCVIGRSMEKNLNLAMDLEYVRVPQSAFIEPHEVSRYPDNQVLIVTTGSQGEPMSALFRMSINEHRHVKLKETDTVVLSSKAIPGNEPSVSAILNQIHKTGATVAYYEFSEIHVSGHAAQEEQKLMLRLTKPKYFIPVHGEYQHLVKHRKTGIECGVDPRNTILLGDGEQIEVSHKGLKKVKNVRTGKQFIDNQANKEIDSSVVFDRQSLANDGIVMLVMQISKHEGKIIDRPRVTSYGLVGERKERGLAKELEEILEKYIAGCKEGDFQNVRGLENGIRQALKKHIFRATKKYPIIVPTIFVQ